MHTRDTRSEYSLWCIRVHEYIYAHVIAHCRITAGALFFHLHYSHMAELIHDSMETGIELLIAVAR
jgi:hypothetical protein